MPDNEIHYCEQRIRTCSIYLKTSRENKQPKAWSFWMHSIKRYHKAIRQLKGESL